MSKNNKNKNKIKQISSIIFLIIITAITINFNNPDLINNLSNEPLTSISYNLEDIPEYNNEPYAIINNSIPNFKESDFTKESNKYTR